MVADGGDETALLHLASDGFRRADVEGQRLFHEEGQPSGHDCRLDVAVGERRYADIDGVEALHGDEVGVGIVSTRAKPSGKFGCAGEIGIGDTDDHDVLHTGQHSDMPLGDASGADEAYSETSFASRSCYAYPFWSARGRELCRFLSPSASR